MDEPAEAMLRGRNTVTFAGPAWEISSNFSPRSFHLQAQGAPSGALNGEGAYNDSGQGDSGILMRT